MNLIQLKLQEMEKETSYVNKFEKHLDAAGLKLKLSNNIALVKKYITAEFARQLFGDAYYFQLILREDAMIKAVLK